MAFAQATEAELTQELIRTAAPESQPGAMKNGAASPTPAVTQAADPDRKTRAAQRYYTLLSLLAALGVVLLGVLLLSRALQSWRRRLLDERSASRRTTYVDAWAQSRVTEEQIRRATSEEPAPDEDAEGGRDEGGGRS